MLHILWLILKFILILLGVILGLLLLIILTVLFCPLRYRARAKKKREDGWKEFQAEGQVSWLFHAISLKISYGTHGVEQSLSIFGMTPERLRKIFFHRSQAAPKASRKKSVTQKEMSETEKPLIIDDTGLSDSIDENEWNKQQEDVTDSVTESGKALKLPQESDKTESGPDLTIPEETDICHIPEKQQKSPASEQMGETPEESAPGLFARVFFPIWEKLKAIHRKFRKFFKHITDIPDGIRKKAAAFLEKIRRITKEINWWREFVDHPRTREALSFLWKNAKGLIRHIFPTRIRGHITFGSEDPAVTGAVLAGLGMSFPLHRNCVAVTPLFEEGNVFEGDVDLKGRIYGAVLLRTAIRIYFNKNIKYVIRRWRHKEVKQHGER